MSLKQEFEKAFKERVGVELMKDIQVVSCREVWWAAKWMAERCAFECKLVGIANKTKIDVRADCAIAIRQLAKSLDE